MVTSVGDLLRQFLLQRGWGSGNAKSQVFSRWSDIVGEPVGRHSKPEELEDGVLTVSVDHPGWHQVLYARREEILGTMARILPEAAVKVIRVRLTRERFQ